MDYDLDYSLSIQSEPEYKSLYSWAIVETGADGSQAGRDQIPWKWTCWFTAISCVVTDRFEIVRPFSLIDDGEGGTAQIETDQIIRVSLHSGLRRTGGWEDEISLSMFATKRAVEDIALEIRPLDDNVKEECCSAWGSVQYTTEIDYRSETFPDCLRFYLWVKPALFAKYAALIQLGRVDDITFSVGPVDGFYSEWSPSISTSQIKILLTEEVHKMDACPASEVRLPRLGMVRGARLLFNRRLKLSTDTASA